MKLNPFSKKSSAYYAKVKADFDKLDRELTAAKDQLNEAEADFERKRRRQSEVEQRGSMYSSTNAEKQAALATGEASNLVGHIKGEIGQLQSQIAPLRRIAMAPDAFAQAKKSLEDLLAQQAALIAEADKTDAQIAKVSKRIASVEERIGAETKSATATMLNEEGDFLVPESLTRLEAELRLGKASLAELQSKREDVAAQLSHLPQAINEARREFIGCRAVIAEIELYEQLVPVMNLFARASAARSQNSYGHDERRFEIEIPGDLIESAETALASEMPIA